MKPRPGNKLFKNRTFAIFSSLILIVAAAGGIYLAQFSNTAESSTPALQTSRVRTGDLIITVSGSGSLVPSAQVDVGFRTSGVVSEVLVIPGQHVEKGDLLASLDDYSQQIAFSQAQANLDALFAPANLINYKGEVASAQQNYDEALLKVQELETVEEGEEPPTEIELALAQARLSKADQALKDAASVLEIIQSGPEALSASLPAVDGTALAKVRQNYLAYENSRAALANTRLVAPMAGTVVSLKLTQGQSVTTAAVVTLAALDNLKVKFYVDETDLAGIAVGNRVLYSFNAYPDDPLEGKITSIEGTLQTVEGSPVVVVWGSVEAKPGFTLLSGMTADVEVIAGEAQRALLLPIQALREISPGSYAVFIVQEDGSLRLTPVTVGLRDFANAEILSGLKAGDVVSTGTVETK